MSPTDLGRMLDEISADLPEPDLAEAAWYAAWRHRDQRRRAVVRGIAGVGLAAIVTAGILSQGPHTARPEPEITSYPPAPTGNTFSDGTPYVFAPRAATEARLRRLQTVLPSELDRSATPERLSDRLSWGWGGVAAVSLVYLRERPGGVSPVLVTPDGAQVEADTVVLDPLLSAGGGWQPDAVGPGAIAPDGHHLAFGQPGEVVVLDALSGEVTRVSVPATAPVAAGWTGAMTGIVAQVSEGRGWFIDAKTWKSETGSPRARYAGHYRLRLDLAYRAVSLEAWDAFGGGPVSTTDTPIHVPVAGGVSQTLSSSRGWAARGVYLLSDTAPTNLGILAVQSGLPSNRRFLVIPKGPRDVDCCSPLAWLDGQTLLFETINGSDTWLLAWDVPSGEVRRVTHFTGGLPYPSIALGSL